MSREVKFRVWYEKDHVWLQPRDYSIDGDGYLSMWNGYDLEGSVTGVIVSYSTGLVDKFNRDIFEGDIVKVPEDLSDSLGVVKFGAYTDNSWDTYSYGYYIELSNGGRYALRGEVEIVGNIFENPELMRMMA